MKLSELHTGDSAIIESIKGTGAFRKRIIEMGFVKGERLRVLRAAPLHGPVEYKIMSSIVTLRLNEAELIEVKDVSKPEEFVGFGYRHGHRNLHGGGHGMGHHGGGHRRQMKRMMLEQVFSDVVSTDDFSVDKKEISIALIGNPNCGKTTLYNRLSHSNERVGNYSGVTVDTKATCVDFRGYRLTFTDLPGTYSLSAYSAEELVVRDFLNKQRPDVVVNVVDAGNMERHLYLTTQLIDMGIPVVLALNMYDELLNKGDELEIQMLAKLLGMPIVPTVGKKGKGIYRLMNRIIKLVEDREPVFRHTHINYGIEIEKSINRVEKELQKYERELKGRHLRYIAIRSLERDDYSMHQLANFPDFEEVRPVISDEIYRLEQLRHEDSETLVSNARYAFIRGALRETLKRGSKNSAYSRSQKIDKVLTNKYLGFLIFMLILFGMFQATFVLGKYPMAWIETGVEWLGNLMHNLIPEGMLNDLVVDGIIGGVGGVIVFLPNILILFFIISLMEDTGYMARTAFIMDRLMHLIGLHGKSFIPLIMGFGCNVPAVMATRTLENRRDRMLTMLIIPFMSCSARLPVYIMIAGAVFPGKAGHVVFLMYLIGIFFSIIMALLFKSTFFKKAEAPFVMELPLYRAPGMKMVLKHMWHNTYHYLKKMGGVILIASVIIWALGYFPREVEFSKDYTELISLETEKLEEIQLNASLSLDEKTEAEEELIGRLQDLTYEKESERQAKSYIGRIGKFIEPVIRPLGFDWKMGVSLVAGFAAKEVVVSTMGVLYQADTEMGSEALQDKLQKQKYTEGKRAGELVYTPLAAFSFLLFVLLYLPCIATVTAIGREGGSWKWAGFVIFYTTALAWLLSFCVYQIGSLF